MSRQNKSKDRFQIITPVDNQVYLERPYASSSEVEEALRKANKARIYWRNLSIMERASYCTKAVDYLVDHADEIGRELTWQMGRPYRYTPSEIKGGLVERATHMIDIADTALSDISTKNKEGFERYIERVPLGTVLVLAPWNYPFLTSINAIIPALVAGNTTILKHATQTALVAERYQEAFTYTGLPPGVFQYLHLNHHQVAQVISDTRINYVAFTGSESGGKAVQSALNQRFISAGMELGGKDPALVRSDADLEYAIENLVDGAYFNSGQSCCGIERIYVHQEAYHDFVDGYVAKVKAYTMGDPFEPTTTLGPMVRSSAKMQVQTQIRNALSSGAEALIGEADFPYFDANSAYLSPQVLIRVTHEMDIMREETFGPVVGIMPVKDDLEAVALMNDSKYGLTASIWTSDLDAAKSVGNQIETGTVFMNRCDYLDPELAWTGIKNSGRGCTLSTLGYDMLTRPKSYHLRKTTS